MCLINPETNYDLEKLLQDLTPDSKDNFDLDTFVKGEDWATLLNFDYPSSTSPCSFAPLLMEPIYPASTTSHKRAAEQVDSEENSLSKKKRKQNEAAQRCRQKKADQIQLYQESIKKLEEEKFEMSVQIAVLTKEKEAFNAREAEMQKTLNDLKELVNFNRALNC
jgi:hypothetical protein